MRGVLLLDKPEGLTSHRLVLKVRKRLKQLGYSVKVGHTGTLDSIATGLMILLLGRATKMTSFFQGLDKTYFCRARLGVATDTYDRRGKVIYEGEVKVCREELEKALLEFEGRYPQLPPPYSAKKIGKKKAYELARQGKEVPLKPKLIHVYQIRLLECSLPFFSFWLHCSSGTYVRRIVHDLGMKLSCGAHVDGLKRESIGPFSLDKAHSLEEVLEGDPDSFVLSLEEALKFLRENS